MRIDGRGVWSAQRTLSVSHRPENRTSALSQLNFRVHNFQLRLYVVDPHLIIHVMLCGVDVEDQALVSLRGLTTSASRRHETHWVVCELNSFSMTMSQLATRLFSCDKALIVLARHFLIIVIVLDLVIVVLVLVSVIVLARQLPAGRFSASNCAEDGSTIQENHHLRAERSGVLH